MKTFTRFIFVLCCFLSVTFNAFAQSSEVNPALTVAENFFQSGVKNMKEHDDDLTYSIGDFTQAILLSPQNGKYYFWRAKVLIMINGNDFALRDLMLARFFKYEESEILTWEETAYNFLSAKPTDLNAFLQSRQSQMSKFAYSKLPAIMEQVPFCTTVADCLKRGEAALQVADYSDRLQSIYAANEALRLSPDNPDALLLRARGYATAGIAQGDDKYNTVNFCEMAANDARRAVAKNPNWKPSNASDDLWVLIEDNAAIRRAPYFYCAEYAKANPARREIDAARNVRAAEVKKEWEADNERIRQENSIPKSSASSDNSSSEIQADYDQLISDLKAADQQYNDAIKKLQRAYEADARNKTTANTFYTGTRARAQRQLDLVHRRIREFLQKYGKRIPANIREELEDWEERVPTTVPI